MLVSKTTEIQGASYEVTQLGAMRGLKLLTRIGAAVGPAMAQLARAGEEGFDIGVAGEALQKLFQKLNEAEIEHFVTEMLFGGALKRNGAPMQKNMFELEMAGQAMTILKLLVFAFEVNYGDFSEAAREFLPRAAVANPSESTTV